MNITDIAKQVNKLSFAWDEFKSTNEQKLRALEAKNGSDPLEEQKIKNMLSKMEQTSERIAMMEAYFARPNIGEAKANIPENLEHKSAFNKFIRKGSENELADLEKKFLSTIGEAEGGYLVTTEIANYVGKYLQDNSALRSLASVEAISSDSLEILKDHDMLETGWAGEVDQRGDTSTPNIDRKKIHVHELYAQPKATQKIIDDSAIDIEKWLADKIAESFAKSENDAFLNGDGLTKPKGILTYDESSIQQLACANEEIITDNDIMNLFYSLDIRYQNDASFLMHPATLQKIRMLKDRKSGQYLWNPGLALNSYDTLMGLRIKLCSQMPLPQKGNLAIALGDFKAAYKIVDRQGIRMLRDPFTDKPFVKFYTTKRVGGDVVNCDAIKLLKI